MSERGKLVYSTGDAAKAPATDGSRKPATSRPPAEQRIRVRRERAGRKGKTVTIAGTFESSHDDVAVLHRELKQRCGCGGTLRQVADGWELELQGDRVAPVLAALVARGYAAKRSGGRG